MALPAGKMNEAEPKAEHGDRRASCLDSGRNRWHRSNPLPRQFCEACQNKGVAGASVRKYVKTRKLETRCLIQKAFVLIWMRTVGAERECTGELRGAGGIVASIQKASYHTIYQLSIDIVRY